MKYKMLPFMILSFVFVFSVVSAQEFDVSVSVSPKFVTVNPCGLADFDIDIKNLGEEDDTYSITVTGLPEGWYTLSDDSIDLKSGELGKVYLFVTPYCYGEIETGTFEVSVTVSDGASASDSFTLEVVADHVIEVEMPETIKTCIQESSDLDVTIKNAGNYTEDVILTLSGSAAEFAELEENSVTLEPFEEKTVTIVVKPTGETEIGEYVLELEAKSTSSYASAKGSTEVVVVECYKVEVSYPEEVETCVNESMEFKITVKNVGLKKDSYELVIEDLDYSETIELDADEDETVSISYINEEEGTYDVDFTVESDYVEEEGTITFDVLRCYGVDLSVEEASFEIEMGRGKLIKATITNLGTKDDTFDIASDVDWVSIKPSTVTLASEESEDIYVYYSPGFEVAGIYDVVLTASSENSQDMESLTITVGEVPITVETTVETTIEEEIIEEETTTEPVVEIPTAEAVSILESLWENRVVRALLIAVIVVIIILIIVYLVVMR